MVKQQIKNGTGDETEMTIRRTLVHKSFGIQLSKQF